MSTTRKALAALVLAALFPPPCVEAQAVRGGARGAVTTRLGADIPSAATRVRSAPVATPPLRAGVADHFGRSGSKGRFGHARGFRSTTLFVPYVTSYVDHGSAASDAAVVAALDEVRDAVLDAREAALDARAAAIDAREAASEERFVTHGARAPRAPSGSKVLTWKPGGITPVESAERRPPPGGPGVMLERAAARPTHEAAATRVRMAVPVIPISSSVPWWSRDACTSIVQTQRPQDRRRFPWGLGWLYRYGRDVEVERGVVSAPSFYMRSPLLSGLYRRPECEPDDALAERCAEITLVGDDDAEIAFEVPLPQLDAKSPDALRDVIRTGLADGETVVLVTTDGEDFDLMPGSVREIGAGVCRAD